MIAPPFAKRLLTAAALLGLLSAAACSEEKTYAYFAVRMSIDPTVPIEVMRKITSCGLWVEGSDTAQTAVPCMPGMVGYELGAADFSTDTKAGQIRFVLRAFDFNSTKVIEGMSEYVNILSNKTVSTSVVGQLVSGGMTDGGVVDAAPKTDTSGGGGTDTATDSIPGDVAPLPIDSASVDGSDDV